MWNDWGATAYILKREYAQNIIDTFCKDEIYCLELPEPNDYVQPLIENLLFTTGKTYTIPLFVENINFTSTFVGKDEDINNATQHKNNHIIAHNSVLNMWKNKNTDIYISNNTLKMKWEQDLTKDIRTFTEYDDRDGADLHPLGYGPYLNESGDVVYPEEVTYCNRYHLLEQFNKIKNNCKAILEIGIGRNGDKSFAHVFIKNKTKDTVYLGLDIEDRSFLDNKENNVHTIQNNSSNYQENVDLFKKIGVEKFDFIFIDGWHSINQVLKDWEYTNLLTDSGIVGFHDTSCHPGPDKFINALDKNKWNVIKNSCPGDWGIGFAQKKEQTDNIQIQNIIDNPKHIETLYL
jgi:hypothetical protein